MFKPKGPFCQSCGMPLSRDEQGGGSNADGTKSMEYCSRCYQQGAFTKPEMTVTDMIALVDGKLKAMHFLGFIRKRLTKGIPTLRRWQRA